MSEINREPVPEDKIRETHRGTSIVERGSGNARHRAQGGGARLNILQTKRARQTADDRRAERGKKKKGSAEGLKESSHVSASRR